LQIDAYILASVSKPKRGQAVYLCVDESMQLSVTTDPARAQRFASSTDDGDDDRAPLMAYLQSGQEPVALFTSTDALSTIFDQTDGDLPSSFFDMDRQQLIKFTNTTGYKPRQLIEREMNIKAIPYQDTMRTIADKYAVHFEFHPICPIVGIMIPDLVLEEQGQGMGLPLAVFERLLFSIRDFAVGLYSDVDVDQTKHSERIGSSFSIVLDTLDNNCENCVRRIPGLATMANNAELYADSKDAWGKVRCFIVLDARTMYALLLSKDGEEAANEAEQWKTRYSEQGNILMF
jgi:hypothetical protein